LHIIKQEHIGIMNRSIEQALISLIPTHNSDLPPPLLELATSLLAQSQHKASTLKQDEEIARPYACAHLACDRLKISLNLPPIHPRPPVPPRIYKRLYNHLDKILPNHTPSGRSTPGRVRTPSAKLREQDDFLGSRSKSSFSKATAGQERSLADFRTPSSSQAGTPSKPGRSTARKTVAAGLPPWLRPTLRYLCKHLDAAKIGPTVVAGMEAIVCPHGRRTKDEWVVGHMTSLLGSLYLFVWNRVNMRSGIDEARYVRVREEVVEALQEARQSIKINDVSEEEAWEGWKDIQADDIDDAALRINRYGWLESDWAKGIQDLIQREEDNAAEKVGAAKGDRVSAGQLRRGDIMLQDKYDYLSEARRKKFAAWKAKIMKDIVAMERQQEDEMSRRIDW
jgi:origin recognition complex subunit 6